MIRQLTRLWALVSLPAAVAHELSHALLALPWADGVAVEFDADGRAACHVNWDDPSSGALLLTAYAPLWLGSLVGLAALAMLLTGVRPETANEWLLAGALAGYWVVYVAHDPRDRGDAAAAEGDTTNTEDDTNA